MGPAIAGIVGSTYRSDLMIGIDPIESREAIAADLENLQTKFVTQHKYQAPFAPTNALPQVFGFPWQEDFLGKQGIKKFPGYKIVSETSSDESYDALIQDDFSWNDPKKLGIRCFPNNSIKIILDKSKEVLK